MKLTYPKLRIIHSEWYQDLCEEQGEIPEFQQILADRIDVDKRYLSLALNCKITFRAIQDRIAKEVCLPVGELFGDDAWFVIADRKRKVKELKIRELVEGHSPTS